MADYKNRQDRFVPIPDMIWQMILSYYFSLPKDRKPHTCLFTQQLSTSNPMDKQWLQIMILVKRTELGLCDKLTAHSFRHAYATHSYENGMDLLTLKTFLGHLEYLGRYTHRIALSNSRILSVSESQTTFSARGKRPGEPGRIIKLDNEEFIRGFCCMCFLPVFRKYGTMVF